MKKLAFLFIAIVTIVSLSACRIEKVSEKNEPKKTFTLNLHDFNSISNQSNCNIFFTQSDTFKVVLKAPQHWYDTHTIADRTILHSPVGHGLPAAHKAHICHIVIRLTEPIILPGYIFIHHIKVASKPVNHI